MEPKTCFTHADAVIAGQRSPEKAPNPPLTEGASGDRKQALRAVFKKDRPRSIHRVRSIQPDFRQ